MTSVFSFDLGAVLSLAAYENSGRDCELWHLFHGSSELSLAASGSLILSDHTLDREELLAFSRIEFSL